MDTSPTRDDRHHLLPRLRDPATRPTQQVARAAPDPKPKPAAQPDQLEARVLELERRVAQLERRAS